MLPIPNVNTWLIAGGAFGAFLIAAAGTATFYERVVMPARLDDVRSTVTEQVTLEQQRICRDQTAIAAAEARAIETLRQTMAGEAALEAFRKESVAKEAARVAEIETLEQENRRYAEQLAAEGRSCPLDDESIDWIRGMRGNSAPITID